MHNYTINDHVIKLVSYIKDLGIILCTDLSFLDNFLLYIIKPYA